MVNMGEERESGVQDNSKVTDFGGGGDGGAVNVKGEVLSGVGDLSQKRVVPVMPRVDWRREMRMEWLIRGSTEVKEDEDIEGASVRG